MPTTIFNSQVENLRQYADGDMVVRADGDHFSVSSNSSLNRLIVWMQAKLLPESQTRQITEARERFIAAIGNRYGAEGGAAARDVLGANSRKPLRSRHIRRVFDTLDRKQLGQPHPAPRESAINRASVPSPGDPPGPRENDLARAEAEQAAGPDSLSATEISSTVEAEQAAGPDSLSETELASTVEAEQAAGPGLLDNPLDAPPAAAVPPIDTVAMEVQSEPRADPLLEPYQRAGIATEYAQPFLEAGIPPEAAAKFLQRIVEREDDPQEVFQSGLPLKLLQEAYNTPPLGLRDARMLHNAGLDSSIFGVYAHYNLPFAADTMIRYTDRNVTRPLHKLGHGRFNTVYDVVHDDGDRRIFKPLSPPDLTRKNRVERGWVASRSGIDPYDPQTAVRNLSTCRLAEELGFDVVVRTELGLHTLPEETRPVLGLVMEVAPGLAARAVPPKIDVFTQPDTRREITKLQLLDCLTAQGDRHGRNYFIGVRPDLSIRVAGIDNDQCLGSWIHHPDVMRRDLHDEAGRGFRGCGLPPVIDTDMARALEDLTPDRVGQLLEDKLHPDEVDSTLERLSFIKDHIEHLRQEGRIIEADAWGDAIVESLTDPTNSYFQRERRKQLGIAGLGTAAAALKAM